MENLTPTVSPQEKLSAALGSIVFFLPILMGVKTEYVVGYMKQGFAINIIQVVCSLVSMFLWMLAPILGLVNFIFFLVSLFLAFQAYSGHTYVITLLSDMATRLIKTLNLANLFTP
jgi:uncharacterized membrane protein